MTLQRYGCGFSGSWAALLLWMYASAWPAQSAPNQQYQLAIARGPVTSVLEQFSLQTQLQIVAHFAQEAIDTEKIGSFHGRGTADQALRQLLRETGLEYKWLDAETIRIFQGVRPPPRTEDNVAEVVVTGTRLASPDDGPTPVRVFKRKDIEHYGITSVADVARHLTQQPFAFSAGNLQSGAQFAQLRGLGADTALVLINGRRMAPSANSISLHGVDLNSIPVTAVERIEVMSDAASSIYGADAIGGVVNIILKDAIEAPELDLHYGQAEGGGTQRRAAVSLGIANVGTTNDCLKSALVLDYFDTAALMGAERELWKNQDYRRFGGQDYRVGQASPFSDWSIAPFSRRVSAYGSVKCSRAGGIGYFGEVLAQDNNVILVRGPPSVSRQLVPEHNPFNPHGVPVEVDYSFTGMEPISHRHEMQLLRLVGGAHGRINHWDWEIAGLHNAQDGRTITVGDIDRFRLVSAIDSSDPATAINLFAESPGPDPLLASLRSPPQQLSFSLADSQLSAFIKGPAFVLAERTALLVIGGEWRREAARFFESGTRVDASRDIASVYSELKLPLLDELSFNIATRADDHGANARMISSHYGLTWRPTKQWLFRASHGTGFRPASLFESYMPRFRSSQFVADPLRNGAVAVVDVILGGNPGLEPATSRSFTAGFVFSPSELPGLRVGASHWRIEMHNRITVPIYQELLTDSQFADRVVRDPPNSQDLQMCMPGRVRSIDLRRVNYGALDTSGIDFDTSFAVERSWGSLRFDLAATWVDEYLSRDMNQVLPRDRVGIANVQGTIPEWRVVGKATWKLDGFGVSSTTTFVPSYRDAHWWTGALDRRIGSQTLVDLQTWVEFRERALLDGLTLTLGARNLFDVKPEFAHAGASLGYDFSLGDLTGRFTYLRLGRRF